MSGNKLLPRQRLMNPERAGRLRMQVRFWFLEGQNRGAARLVKFVQQMLNKSLEQKDH